MTDLAESILALDRRIRFVAIFDEQTRETLGIDRRKAERFSLAGPQLRRLSRIIGRTRGYGPNTKRKYFSFSIEEALVMLTVDESCQEEIVAKVKDYVAQRVTPKVAKETVSALERKIPADQTITVKHPIKPSEY